MADKKRARHRILNFAIILNLSSSFLESVFMKYADVEAAAYTQMMEEKAKLDQERKSKQQ